MSELKVAAQLYTLREHLAKPSDVDPTLKKVRELGYEYVQVSAIGREEPIDNVYVKEVCDKYGLKICATHNSADDFTNNLDELIKKHKLWDCKYAGIGSMPPQARESKETVMKFAKEYSDIAKRLADKGIHFIYHNHSFEFVKFGSQTMLDILFENTCSEFQFEIDTHWVQRGGASPLDWIYKVEGRMGVVHFKDMIVVNGGEPRFAEIGYGNLNWEKIIKACKDTGVEYAPVEQDKCYGKNEFDCLKKSFDFLKDNV